MMEPQIHVGHVIKAFGRDGKVRVVIKDQFVKDVYKAKYLLIEQDGYNIPFFIEKYNTEDGLILFEDIRGPEQAKKISDKKAFLLQRHFDNSLDKRESEKNKNELIGYLLIDQKEKTIGLIKGIVFLPMQIILEIDHHGKSILIPFHENLILGIVPEKEIIQLEIPAGLLEL